MSISAPGKVLIKRYTADFVVKALKKTVLVGVPWGYASGSHA